ncbi:MAG: hypothetical protein ABIM31_01770 [candidate division WOR-3 bacterium]
MGKMLGTYWFAVTVELSSIINQFYTEIFDLVSRQGGEPHKISGDTFIVTYYDRKTLKVKKFIDKIFECLKKFQCPNTYGACRP